ncbi:MAG: DNA-binding protein [Clostridia bacterium]
MEYVTPKDKAAEWGISPRRVEILCDNGRVSGAYRLGRVWAIPKEALKPIDCRTKAAKNDQQEKS